MERFGIPGKTLLGSDSHTCAAGSLAMLAIGAGGIEVAQALAGEPFYLKMPSIWGVQLTGELPDWVSAKDVILEMLRRHGVAGGIGKIIEYYGPGLACLSAMDRHVIANMGAELGATTTVFPCDNAVARFLVSQQRGGDWHELSADADAIYDERDVIDLSTLEPLIACPSSPDNVVPVREVAGREIYQAYIGSSANPGLRDFAIPALMVNGQQVHDAVSFDINPTSRQILENLTQMGLLAKLIRAGARLHQAGCNGCIGMGQAPATGRISLRTVPRNFPGRSGTPEDHVYLCSPETAAASALTGVITDPRTLHMPYPRFEEPDGLILNTEMLVPPALVGQQLELVKGPNIQSLPPLEPLPGSLDGSVLLKLGDNVSTDEIMPAGEQALPYRSNIPAISKFVFRGIDASYYERAMQHQQSGSFIVGGLNYGQGSSREHAAVGPRYLGVKAVIAKSFARIHRQNLINFGILPLTFANPDDWNKIAPGHGLRLPDVREAIQRGNQVHILNQSTNETYIAEHGMTDRQVQMLLAGSLINLLRARRGGHGA
jgi:aconitate hydratase